MMKPTLSLLGAVLLWASSAHGSIIFHANAGSLVGTLNDGDAVSSWDGLVQGDANRRPIFRAAGLNGLPSIEFDGASGANGDALLGGALPGARSILVVATMDATANSLAGLISNRNDRLNVRRNDATSFYRSVGQGGDNNDFYRHGGHVGQDNTYVNGVGSGSLSFGTSHIVIANAGADANFTNFTVGGASLATGGALSSRYWDGLISEIYVFDRTLNTDEIIGLSSMLADRWNSAPVAATPAQLAAGYAVLVPEPTTSMGLFGLVVGMFLRRKRRSTT